MSGIRKTPKRDYLGAPRIWWPTGLKRMRAISERLAECAGVTVAKHVRDVYCEGVAKLDPEAKEVWENYKRAVEE